MAAPSAPCARYSGPRYQTVEPGSWLLSLRHAGDTLAPRYQPVEPGSWLLPLRHAGDTPDLDIRQWNLVRGCSLCAMREILWHPDIRQLNLLLATNPEIVQKTSPVLFRPGTPQRRGGALWCVFCWCSPEIESEFLHSDPECASSTSEFRIEVIPGITAQKKEKNFELLMQRSA